MNDNANLYGDTFQKGQRNKPYVYGLEIIPFLKTIKNIESIIDMSKENDVKIFFCGDSLFTTSGLSYSMVHIMYRICKHYNAKPYYLTFTGKESSKSNWLYYNDCNVGEDDDLEEFFQSIKFINCQQGQEQLKSFSEYVLRFEPTYVFSFLDPWLLECIAFCDYREKYYWIPYLTFEVEEYPEYVHYPSFINKTQRVNIQKILEKADCCIPVTKMGKKILKDFHVSRSENVYLGVEHLECYKEEGLSKSKVFGSKVKDTDFVFMVVGKNTERKRLDFSVQAFFNFLTKYILPKDQEKFKLFVHTDVSSTWNSGTDLLVMTQKLGIQNNVLFSKCFLEGRELNRRELSERYAVCDCYVGLSFGEGFGYGYAEAISEGTPCIFSLGGGHSEYLLQGCGLEVKTSTKIQARDMYLMWNVPDVNDAAFKMKEMYDYIINNTEEYQYFRNNCLSFSRENFDWDKQVNKIIEVFDLVKDKRDLCKFNYRRVLP